jgi:uncharacterized RDD family membrane protein YckC
MSETTTSTAGYLSEEDKRRFTIVVGVLGAVFFMLQFIAPMVAMFALMPSMMLGTFRGYDVRNAALYRGRVCLVESTDGFAREMQGRTDSRLVELTDEGIQEVAPLEGWRPKLLADGEKLCLVSSTRVATLENERLTSLPVEHPLGDICGLFLYRGAPAVIETRPEGSRLMTWGDLGWAEGVAIDSGRDRCAIQPISVEDAVWVFRREGDTLFVRETTAESPRWDVVLSRPDHWYAFEQEGRPAVASLSHDQGFRIARYDGDKWVGSPGRKSDARLATSLAAFPTGDAAVLVVSETFPGSLRLQTWDGERLVAGKRFGGSFPFSPAMMSIMMLPQVAIMLSSLLLAMILASLMRAHRITTYRYEGVQVDYASLTRRALAQLIDGLLLGFPGALIFWQVMGDFESLFEAGPMFPLRFMALWLGSLLWAVLLFVGFSITEGLWGATPGKWALGIRALGTNLEPCGLGRALVRNALKFVDGFFNYLVGILLVAYTPEWQRLGDLAARTVVIRPSSRVTLPPSPNRDSSPSR